MKKIIVLAFGVILIAVLAFYAIELSQKDKSSDTTNLIDFGIQDTAAVDKIELYDSFFNQEFTLVRGKDGVWVDKDGNCVQQTLVHTMLETFHKVTFKGYVAEGAMENMTRLLMAKHKRVKIYQNGKWVKTWYVGHPNQEHSATHMLLETPNKKSDNPVLMSMLGFYGILEPRFFADARRFECTFLFSYERTEINRVAVKNGFKADDSFEIQLTGTGYEVRTNGELLDNILKDNLTFYMNGFKNIHFNQPNFTLSEEDIAAMKSRTPDYHLEIDAKGKKLVMSFYRRENPDQSEEDAPEIDPDYLWGITPSGEVVRMQFYVIGPILDGKTVFCR